MYTIRKAWNENKNSEYWQIVNTQGKALESRETAFEAQIVADVWNDEITTLTAALEAQSQEIARLKQALEDCANGILEANGESDYMRVYHNAIEGMQTPQTSDFTPTVSTVPTPKPEKPHACYYCDGKGTDSLGLACDFCMGSGLE